MIILDSVDKSLAVVLSGAVATNECPIVASWVSLTTAATSFLSAASDLETAGATPVEVIPAPIADAQVQLKFLSTFNADTAPVTVIVQYLDGADTRVLVSVTLAAGSTLTYTDGEGWRVLTADGTVLSGLPLPALVGQVASDQVTTSVTLVSVPGLSLTLLPNAVYAFSAVLAIASSTADGAKYAVACSSAGSTVSAVASGTLSAVTTRTARISALATATAAFNTAGADGGLTLAGRITTGALSGVLSIQQECAVGGNVTTYTGSLLSALRIA